MPSRSTLAAQSPPDPRIDWPAGHEPASARVFAQNITDITASPEAVWSLLIDCVAWPSWYEHCTDVSVLRGGPLLGPGSRFRFRTLGYYFEPEIDSFDPCRLLVWSARGPAGTSGAHAWYIEPTPGGCRVVTEEAQKGLLLAIIGHRTRERLLTVHGEWLRALKQLAEHGRWRQGAVSSVTAPDPSTLLIHTDRFPLATTISGKAAAPDNGG